MPIHTMVFSGPHSRFTYACPAFVEERQLCHHGAGDTGELVRTLLY